MSPHPTTTLARRLARHTVLALGCALLLFAATPAMADTDNQGTVKVHNPDEIGDASNDPHVDCVFFVEGFNMEATEGTLVIKDWPPTGNMTVVFTGTWTADDSETSGNHFLNGPMSLPAGHYKLFASDVQHDKMKTFWVDCATTCTTDCTPCETDCTTTTGTSTGTGSTTTEVPVFPSGTAIALGVAGALGGSLLLLRRRR